MPSTGIGRRSANAAGLAVGFLVALGVLACAAISSADDSARPVDRYGTVRPLSAGEVQRAQDITERSGPLRTVLARNGVRHLSAERVGVASSHRTLLQYRLATPIRGTTRIFHGDVGKAGGAPVTLTVPIERADELEVLVDTASGEIASVTPGFGTRYGRPSPGDTIPLADGSAFTLTATNFVYHQDIGAVELRGLPSGE